MEYDTLYSEIEELYTQVEDSDFFDLFAEDGDLTRAMLGQELKKMSAAVKAKKKAAIDKHIDKLKKKVGKIQAKITKLQVKKKPTTAASKHLDNINKKIKKLQEKEKKFE